MVNKIKEVRPRWLELVKSRCEDALVRRCERLAVAGVESGCGSSKKI